MADNHGPPDLAVLGFDDLRELAKKNSVSSTGLNRADLVKALRDEGIGQPRIAVSGKPYTDPTVIELLQTVKDLVKEMAAMKSEILSLRSSLEASKSDQNEQQLHPPLTANARPQMLTSSSSSSVLSSTPASTSLYSAKVSRYLPNKESVSVPVTTHRTPPPPHSTNGTIHRAVTSYYHRPPAKSSILCGASRTKCKALYLGNVNTGCSADSIAQWCQKKKVDVIKCSVSETKYFGTAFAHLVICESDLGRVLSKDFWPDTITVREWRFKNDRISDDSSDT